MVSCAEAQAYLEEQEQLRHRLQEAIHEVMTLISCGSTGMSDTGMLIPRISHAAHATSVTGMSAARRPLPEARCPSTSSTSQDSSVTHNADGGRCQEK